MPAYDRERFAPPAPVAKVRIRNPESGATVDDVVMLIDSGADATLLPRHVVEALALPPLGERYGLLAFDNTPSEAAAVRAQLVFLARNFTGLFLVIRSSLRSRRTAPENVRADRARPVRSETKASGSPAPPRPSAFAHLGRDDRHRLPRAVRAVWPRRYSTLTRTRSCSRLNSS